MYVIIGGDGREYGPISAEDLRKWIAEGRLNAQSQAKAEGDAVFRPLSAFPELADAFGHPAPSAPAGIATSTNWAERDYELDIMGCISRGWDAFKNNFGVLFLATVITFAMLFGVGFFLGLVLAPINRMLVQGPAFLQIGFNYLLPIVTSLLVGPLFGGLYFTFLKALRGQTAGVGDIFAGFPKAFGQLYLGALVPGLLVGACLLPFHFFLQTKAGPVLEQFQRLPGHQPAPEEVMNMFHDLIQAYAGTLPVLLLCLIPVTYLTVSWAFTLPLIIDKQLNFWPAMKAGWRMVHKHWWHVFGLVVIIGLINVVGVLACCVGLLFTSPMTIAITMSAYETIFGDSRTG